MSYSSTRSPVERYINAAKDGYLDALQQGTRKDLNTPDEDGMTATMWASRNGHLEALRLIVGRGGDVDRCDYLGLTPLHHAASRGLIHVVSYLVNWGANIFALNNDNQSALDLALENSKSDVAQFLDAEAAQQQMKNPKHAAKLREKAQRQMEESIKKYEKLTEQAAKEAEKQQRKLANDTVRSHRSPSLDEASQQKERKGIFQSVTMALRGNKSQRSKMSTQSSGKTYSDIAGISQGPKGGVAKKINRRSHDLNGTTGAHDAFKVSDLDQSGKRTLRSAQGVLSGKSSDVMYLTGQRGGGEGTRASTEDLLTSSSSRPTAQDVFSGHNRSLNNNLYKSKSEPDLLLDSGNGSYFEDEDEENSIGIFNRPGFGKTAFFSSSKFANTLQSFENGQGDADGALANGLPHSDSLPNGEIRSSGHEGLGVPAGPGSWVGDSAKEIPWDPDEVDPLDDDDDQTVSSPIEMLLWSEGLENYLHRFLQEKVDLDMLVKTKNLDADLKEIGLPFGPRKKLQDSIQRRKDILDQPKYLSDSFL